MLREVARVLAALAIGVSALLAYTAFRINDQGTRDDARPSDAIVVLGAAQFNGVAGGVFAARLDHAIDLFRQGLAPYLIVTGGNQPGDRTTEAATARAYARARGVPASRILMENEGRSTLESLQNVAVLMRAHDLKSATFVSDRTHMLRVLRMAKDLGIDSYASPTTTSPTDLDAGRRSRAMLHEMAGMVAYFLGVGAGAEEPPIGGAP